LSLSNTSANPPEIWLPAFFVGFGLFGFYLIAIILRTRNEILIRERRTEWVDELLSTNFGNNISTNEGLG